MYNKDFQLIDELDLQLKSKNPEQMVASPEALKVTGINLEEHLNDPQTVTYEKGQELLLKMLKRNKLPRKRRSFRPCGQNIEFDINFIKKQLISPEEWGKHIHYNTIDTLRILTFLQDTGILPSRLGKLESMVQYFNIPMGIAHNAKEDIRMTVDVYKAMRQMIISSKQNMSGVNNQLLEIVEE